MVEEKKISKHMNFKNYEQLQTVGVGSFGRVRLCKDKNDGTYYVLKILRKATIIELKQIDHIHNENLIMSMIDHPFIVSMRGFDQDAKHLILLLEYIPGGELFSYLRACEKFDPDQAQFFAAQVILIFEYLHTQDIVYRDLKPENLLLDPKGYMKLTDFGFAKIVTNRTYTLCGTPEYLAPEMLMNKGHGKPVDWWTLGILLYEMIAGIDPFSDEDPMAIYKKILKGKVKFPRSFDKKAKSLCKHLLENDIVKRFGNLVGGVDDIKDHRFFDEFSFEKLLSYKLKSPYVPPIDGPGDTKNFSKYPESEDEAQELSPEDDPFLDW